MSYELIVVVATILVTSLLQKEHSEAEEGGYQPWKALQQS